MRKPLRILAIDYGTQKIGLAVGQSLTNRAQPLGIIPVRQKTPAWDQLDQTIKQWRPDKLIIGLPLNMDGSESELATEVRGFADTLSDRYDIPIDLMDERLTTREAKATVMASTAGSKQKKTAIDAIAAALIAETWLQEHSK